MKGDAGNENECPYHHKEQLVDSIEGGTVINPFVGGQNDLHGAKEGKHKIAQTNQKDTPNHGWFVLSGESGTKGDEGSRYQGEDKADTDHIPKHFVGSFAAASDLPCHILRHPQVANNGENGGIGQGRVVKAVSFIPQAAHYKNVENKAEDRNSGTGSQKIEGIPHQGRGRALATFQTRMRRRLGQVVILHIVAPARR